MIHIPGQIFGKGLYCFRCIHGSQHLRIRPLIPLVPLFLLSLPPYQLSSVAVDNSPLTVDIISGTSTHIKCLTCKSVILLKPHWFVFRYSVMTDCWREDPEQRPTFQKLSQKIKKMSSDVEVCVTFKAADRPGFFFSTAYVGFFHLDSANRRHYVGIYFFCHSIKCCLGMSIYLPATTIVRTVRKVLVKIEFSDLMLPVWMLANETLAHTSKNDILYK